METTAAFSASVRVQYMSICFDPPVREFGGMIAEQVVIFCRNGSWTTTSYRAGLGVRADTQQLPCSVSAAHLLH
jgi:hypothetical protein